MLLFFFSFILCHEQKANAILRFLLSIFVAISTQTNELNCFIFQGTLDVVHAVFYCHAFRATRKYLWSNRDGNENETHKERKKTETNLKDKMSTDVHKAEDAKEVHFDFQFICATFEPLSEHYSVRKLHTI